jgi:DNA-binding CsgD family transcriptional regulator
LASDAHVTLTGVPPVPVDDSATLPGLTAREREILRHVMAGRTYGEIARTLVLSKKTVSVHVSNMLRKTGAANRLALVQLARRRISTR